MVPIQLKNLKIEMHKQRAFYFNLQDALHGAVFGTAPAGCPGSGWRAPPMGWKAYSKLLLRARAPPPSMKRKHTGDVSNKANTSVSPSEQSDSEDDEFIYLNGRRVRNCSIRRCRMCNLRHRRALETECAKHPWCNLHPDEG